MQSLYEWDFHPGNKIEDIAVRVAEPVKKDVDMEYVLATAKGVVKCFEEMDQLIANAAPEWPLEQISVIDKTILRLAAYELLKSSDIPPKVAINEAVEISKTFGGENSSKFINGVLGTLYRQSDRYQPEDEPAAKSEPDIEPSATPSAEVETKPTNE